MARVLLRLSAARVGRASIDGLYPPHPGTTVPFAFALTFLTTTGLLFFYLGGPAVPLWEAAGASTAEAVLTPGLPAAAEKQNLRSELGGESWEPMRKPLPVRQRKTALLAAHLMPRESVEKNLLVRHRSAAPGESAPAAGDGKNSPRQLRARNHRAAALVARLTAEENVLPGEFAIRGAFISFDGPADWSIDDFEKIERFYLGRFGRLPPVSAMGQSETHERLGLDHRDAVDIAVRPESPEGRALMAYLRRAGIPFIAFRGRFRGVSTGAHIHIGRPSPRLLEVRQRAVPIRYDEGGQG